MSSSVESRSNSILETVNCNLCSSDYSQVYLEVGQWLLVRCRECGLIYLNPRPSVHELPELYSSEYFTEVISSDFTHLPTSEREIETLVRSQSLRVQRLGQHASPPGRLLDVGCGPGFFLACASRQGWDVQGIDISQWAADYAEEYLGLEVQVKAPAQIGDLWHNAFDAITMFHLLEHLPDPLEALQAIREALRENGVLIIVVPNISGFEARYYDRDWRGLSIPYHLYHFTPDTATQMLGKAGLEVLTVHKHPSQLVADWIKRLIGRSSLKNGGEKEMGDATSYVPRVSCVSKIYAATLGRIFTGRGMTVVARK